MSSDWHSTLKNYYDNYDPVEKSRAGPSIYDALPTVSRSSSGRSSTSHYSSESRQSSRYDSSSRHDDYESNLRRTGAKSRAHSRTTRDWGPTNSDMDIRSTYDRDSLRRSSTFASSRGSRRHESSTATIGRKESRQFDPGVDLSTYGGSFYDYDKGSTMKRSQTTRHSSKNSSGRESVYDVDLSTLGGGAYSSKSSKGRDSSFGGYDSTSFASRTDRTSRYDSGKSSGSGSYGYGSYGSFF